MGKATKPPGRIAAIGYAIDRSEGTAHRNDRALGFWKSGFIQGQRVLVQTTERETFVDQVANAIVGDLTRTHPSDLTRFPDGLAQFESLLADKIGRSLRRSSAVDLDWYRCVALLEKTIPDVPIGLVHILEGIRRFEAQLADAASALPPGIADPTRGWDIESMVCVTLSRRRYDPARAPRLAYDLMDLKFKLFCIACVDLPIYVAQLRVTGADKPAGRIVGLSFDSLLGFKLRALWETVMNLTYHLETGMDADDWGRNKSKRWWEWIRKQPQWRSLAKFRRTLELYEGLVRTPEAHKSSRMRSLFAANRSPRRHRILAQELANLSIAVWDHLTFVVTTGTGVTYSNRRQVVKPNSGRQVTHRRDPIRTP
jgi:hypothetical protein